MNIAERMDDNEPIGWGILCPTGMTVYWVGPRRDVALEALRTFGLGCNDPKRHRVVQVRI